MIEDDKGDEIMILKFNYLLCWLGIHKYKIIDSTFGFGASGTIKKVKCKICGATKIKKG